MNRKRCSACANGALAIPTIGREDSGKFAAPHSRRLSVSCIVPPHILQRLMASEDTVIRDIALNTLLSTTNMRGERTVRAMTAVAAAPDTGRRTIYDCGTGRQLPGATLARTESGNPSADASVNRAFEGFGKTRDFYKQVLQRDSIDDHGMRLNGYVHYGKRFQNAFWDGQEMVFGDGDGKVFGDFTLSLDVIAHELTHGVTEYTANLEYHMQPGALNESISDVFGSLVKQWSKNQQAHEADWLIGAEIFTPEIGVDALRSMKAPGTAYDNDLLGKDPQPDHMSGYENSPDTESGDFGGVHTNSGIPNKAFYLTAMSIGGNAWKAPGHIWYESLKASTANTQFQGFADTTFSKAGQLYGTGSIQQKAVRAAWEDVGIHVGEVALLSSTGLSSGSDSLVALTTQIEYLSAQLNRLQKDVAALHPKA